MLKREAGCQFYRVELDPEVHPHPGQQVLCRTRVIPEPEFYQMYWCGMAVFLPEQDDTIIAIFRATFSRTTFIQDVTGEALPPYQVHPASADRLLTSLWTDWEGFLVALWRMQFHFLPPPKAPDTAPPEAYHTDEWLELLQQQEYSLTPDKVGRRTVMTKWEKPVYTRERGRVRMQV